MELTLFEWAWNASAVFCFRNTIERESGVFFDSTTSACVCVDIVYGIPILYTIY